MGLKHVLFVTSGLRGTGIVDEVKSIFEKAGVAVSIYDKVESLGVGLHCHGYLLICSTGPDTF